MNEFELARCDFQKVLDVNPQNKAAKSQITVCQKKTKEHNDRDRKIYANMFKKFAERDAKEEASKTTGEKEDPASSEIGLERTVTEEPEHMEPESDVKSENASLPSPCDTVGDSSAPSPTEDLKLYSEQLIRMAK
ncbi:UNVERIFIED_CONTAM: FK506-binding protein 5 [Gekko kuhli]